MLLIEFTVRKVCQDCIAVFGWVLPKCYPVQPILERTNKPDIWLPRTCNSGQKLDQWLQEALRLFSARRLSYRSMWSVNTWWCLVCQWIVPTKVKWLVILKLVSIILQRHYSKDKYEFKMCQTRSCMFKLK